MTAARKPVATEHMEQASLFAWARMREGRVPALRLLFAIPNGAALAAKTMKRGDGKSARFSLEALKLRAEGLKPGVPDVCLPVARGAFHGLYIEMKRSRGGVLSDEQRQWIDDLTSEGFCAVCCAGWESARGALETYLAGGDPR